jgi:hypothetical protein
MSPSPPHPLKQQQRTVQNFQYTCNWFICEEEEEENIYLFSFYNRIEQIEVSCAASKLLYVMKYPKA